MKITESQEMALNDVSEGTNLLAEKCGKMEHDSEMKAMIEKGHARRMGHLENYFSLLQRQDLYTNFSVYGQFNHDVELKSLNGIFCDIFFKNPILVHTLVPKGVPNHEEFYLSEEYLNKPWPEHDYMKILPKLDMDDIILNYQEEYKFIIEDILQQFQDDKFAVSSKVTEMVAKIRIPAYHPERPNWGLILLPDERNRLGESRDITRFKNLIFVSNHCSADAMTGVNLFNDIVEAINMRGKDTSSSEDNNSNDDDDCNSETLIYDYNDDWDKFQKIPVPITERIDYRPSLFSLPKFFGTAMIMKYFTYKSPAPLTQRINKSSNSNYHYILNFPPNELQRIKASINKNDCSMTGFLQTCLFVSFKKSGLFDDRDWKEMGFDISIPNDNRRRLPLELVKEQYKYGSNVAGSHYAYLISSFSEENFWDLNKYYTNVVKNSDYLIGLGSLMLDFVYQNQNIDKIITDSYLDSKRGGVILSNIGFLKQAQLGTETSSHGMQKINDIKFMQDVGVLNFSYSVNVSSTAEGGMNLCISCVEGAVPSRQDFERVCQELRMFILSITEQARSIERSSRCR